MYIFVEKSGFKLCSILNYNILSLALKCSRPSHYTEMHLFFPQCLLFPWSLLMLQFLGALKDQVSIAVSAAVCPCGIIPEALSRVISSCSVGLWSLLLFRQ
jgi:hypothetical protein